MKLRWSRGLVIMVGVVALLLVVGVAGLAALRRPKPIASEKIVAVERGDIARSVVARGKIEPLSKVEVKAKANGLILSLLADVGDSVTNGQILAELDKVDLQAQVREASATRDRPVAMRRSTREGRGA